MAYRLSPLTGAVAVLMLVAAAFVSAQGPADTRPAEQAYKNIKVMQGVPANQISQSMHLIKAALGVDCTHCHIEMQWDLEDVQPMKDKARAMYKMMVEINRVNFKGEQVVTCFTCHKGKAIPDTYPAMPAPEIKPEPENETKVVLPTADQVLAKYVTALGGEQALRKVTSRVITGSLNIATGPGGTIPTPATLERSMKAPNLVVDVYTTEKYAISNGFDGTVAWARNQNGAVATPGGIDLERARRAAAFYEPLTIKQQYPTITVVGIEKVNGRDAYAVTGTPAGNTPETLYFDTQTGLLLRKWTYLETASGKSPYQMDFDDYRDTGSGSKIPFTVRMAPSTARIELEPTSTLRITKVQDNMPLDNAKFVKPAPAPPAAPRQ